MIRNILGSHPGSVAGRVFRFGTSHIRYSLTALMLMLFSVLAVAQSGPVIEAGNANASPGQVISIPVTISGQNTVVAAQFDLGFDASVLLATGVSAGSALNGHQVDFEQVAPGVIRVVITTGSQATLSNGRLVSIGLQLAAEAVAGEYPLQLSNVVLADAQGDEVIPASVENGLVTVGSATLVDIPTLGLPGYLLLAILLSGLAWVFLRRGVNGVVLSFAVATVLFSSVIRAVTLPGDANDDGQINAADIPVIAAQILERATAPGNPDCNEDSRVDVLDTVCVSIADTPNNPPTMQPIVDRTATVGDVFQVAASASDADLPDDVLTFSLDTAPAGMGIGAANGLINWTPDNGQLGPHAVTVRVTDLEGLFATTSFIVTVVVVQDNSSPNLLAPGNRVLEANVEFNTNLFATDPDVGDTLSFSLPLAPAGMSVDPSSGLLNWLPGVADLGNHPVTARVSDSGGLTDEKSFTVEVLQQRIDTPSNRSPLLTVPANSEVVFGNPLALNASATDPDIGDTLTFSLAGSPPGMSINATSGAISWTPVEAQVGAHDVTVKVTDASGAVALGSFVVRVLDINRAPLAVDDVYEARLGVPLSIPAPGVLGNDSDPDGDAITAVLQSDAGKGQLTLNADGSFDYLLEPTDLTRPVELELECEITLAGDGSRYLGNNTLAVGDVDNDGDIEIVGINNIDGSTALTELWILNASDCSEQSYINQEAAGSFGPQSHPGLLDIDGDGDLEIITVRHDGEHLIAVHHDGSLAWPGDGGSETSPLMESLSGTLSYRLGGPTFADLDGDGTSEIIMGFAQGINFSVYAGAVAYDATDGSLLWEYFSDFRAGGGGQVRIPTVVDLDLDGTMEVIIHNDVLSHTGVPEFPSRLPTYEAVGTGTGGRVVTAVANFDEDAYPEVLARDERGHYLFNHDGTVIWEIERRNFANSQLTVADFDGDGAPEYALVNCEPPPGSSACSTYFIEVFDGDGSRLWSHKGDATLELQIGNSTSDNITAFDANRDGSFDLVFQNIDINADQIFIFDGRDGSILESIEVGSYGSSGVRSAFLTIADVDGDGDAEIVTSHTGGIVGDTQVWGGTAANPLPTAPTYRNQWAFQAGYSTDARTMTPAPVPHWLQPGSNGWNLIPRSSGAPVDLEMECEITVAGDGSRYQSSSTLAVGDVDNDGDTEIVGVGHVDGSTALVELWILNASDCSEQSHINQEAVGAFTQASHPGLLDIDGDGDLEIITVRHVIQPSGRGFDGEHLIAVHHDGSLAWPGNGGSETSTILDELLGTTTYGISGPTFADLDADGTSEIIMGFASGGGAGVYAGVVVYDATDGSVLWDYLSDFRAGGGNRARIPAVVDLDLDGTMEIIIHNDVLSHTGVPELRLPTAESVGTSTAGKVVTAVANFDGDAYPEILAIDERNHYLFNHDGTVVWEIERRNFSNSQVTVADFDGDGAPEYALVNCEPPPGGFACSTYYIEMFDGDGSRLWSHQGDSALELNILFSDSENITAFDANRDGSFDLVFQNIDSNVDRILIIDGRNGSVLESIEVGSYWASGVRNAFLTIADVDGDGEAEIVTSHSSGLAGDTQVWGGTAVNPLPAAPSYRNQWAFQDGYSTDAGTMTRVPLPHWLQPGLNGWNLIKPEPDPLIGTTDSFTYVANDGDLNSNEATVTLDILPAGNPPLFLTQPDALTTRGFPYAYEPIVVDPDLGDTVTFSLAAGPAGMTIDPATGEISWNPQTNGSFNVSILALDTIGFAAAQTWVLEVGEPVEVPDVVGQPEATAEATLSSENLVTGSVRRATHPSIPSGSVFEQTPLAGSVAEFGGAVDLKISTGPAPEDIDNDDDGFTENDGDCNDSDDTIYPGAADPDGDGVDQDCDGIDGNAVLSSILITPEVSNILTNQTVRFKAVGIFEDGTSQNLTPVVGWSNGPTFTSATAGTFNISASRDAINATATVNVSARVPGDDVPPTAVISAPASNSTITEPVDIVGTASDSNFLRYELAYAIAGSDEFTTIVSSNSPVNSDVLGTLDPTLLINDLYTVRLSVFDRGGNQETAEITLQVDENLKVGNFTLSFSDLEIPMAGVPISVTRTYDSREKRKGGFGIGWFLDVNTLRLRTNRVLGTGWQVVKSGLSYTLTPTDAHIVSLTFPDGRVERFDMVVSPSVSPIVPFPPLTQSVSYTPRPGTLGQLKSLDLNFVSILAGQPGPVELLRDSDSQTYDPGRFRYIAVDGTQIDIDKRDGVERIVDPNGNTLTFGPDGITHSAGKSVTFQRDDQGRIVEIIDPAGNSQTYGYDGNGDLTSHTDSEGSVVRYKYNLNHGLLSVTDALGNTIATNEFDGDGRLTATFDADGNRVGFQHDLIMRTTIVTSSDGEEFAVEYDERGNIIRSVDALGNESFATFDENGNVTSRTNPLGEVISFEYNDLDKETRRTNGEGHSTDFTYDTTGRLSSVTDANGNVTRYQRDSRGNVTQEIDPQGHVTAFTYDARGNLVSRTDARGLTSQYQYDAFGNLVGEVDSSGTARSYTYNARGELLTAGIELTQADGTVLPFSTTNMLDNRGNLLEWSDSFGNSAGGTFDANGRQLTTTNVLGQSTEYGYSDDGQLTETVLPNGARHTQSYTAAGKVAEKVGPDGRKATMGYGQSGLANSMVDENDPDDPSDDASRELAYDAANRLVELEGPTGTQLGYRYDDSGRIVGTSSGGVELITSQLDPTGEVISTTDINGGVTTFVRDDLNRPIQRQLPDGRIINTAYDANGNVASITEVGGDAIAYQYDEMNRLSGVETGGTNTNYQYDNVGRLVQTTDGLGRETRFGYSLGTTNQLVVTLPLGQQITVSFDAMGNLTRRTYPNGDFIQYDYDNMNRRVSKTLSSGEVRTYQYTIDGKPRLITGPSGDTELFYNEQGLLERQVDPWGFELEYAYDRAGRVTAVTTASGTTSYTHDSVGFLTSITSPAGETTTYDYDPLGNLLEKTLPNGTRELLTYDAASQLTQVQHVAADNSVLRQYTYELGSGGRYSRVTELDGRVVDFDYDDHGRLIQERVQGTAQPDRTITYSYDEVGNRVSKTDSVDGVTSYTYNDNDQLLSSTTAGTQTNYSYDANGNLVSEVSPARQATYQWGVESRLLSAEVTEGGVTRLVTYEYDYRGHRIAEVVNGQRTRFLVDANRQYAQILEEVAESGEVTASYVYDDSVLSRRSNGDNFYYFADGHSGVRSVRNAAEQVVNEYDYDAFGDTLFAQEGVVNPYQYRGERLDDALGQYYLRARVYDQNTGRFLSADPDPGIMDMPLTQHRYLYALGNPVLFSDPSGRAVDMKQLMIGLVIVGTLGAISQQALGTYKAGTSRDVKWDGPNAFLSFGVGNPLKSKKSGGLKAEAGVGFDPGVTLQTASRNGRVTDAIHLVLTGSIGAEIGLDEDNEGYVPRGGGSRGGRFASAFFFVFGILPQYAPVGVSFGDATLYSQAALGGANGIDPYVALNGFYVQLAASVSAPTMFAPLFGGLNSIGKAGVLQGFAAGYSSGADTGLTSQGFSAGIGLNGGFSISLTPFDQINKPGK